MRAALADVGPEILLAGRQDLFTFVNGVYCALAGPGDRPSFRLR